MSAIHAPMFSEHDPYWDNVILLCHFEGSNGSTTYIDEKGHSLTRYNGTGALTTTRFAAGNSSWQPGTTTATSARHIVPNADYPEFDLGTGDFTIEFMAYVTAYGSNNKLVWNCSSIVADIHAVHGRLYTQSAGDAGSTPVPLNQWCHIEYGRSSGVLRAFLNGVKQLEVTYTYDLTRSNLDIINSDDTQSWFVDEIRVTKGVCRHTANFTPPTVPFPNS